MSKVSILMPARNESYLSNNGQTVLQRTVDEILNKSHGDIELLIMFDGSNIQTLPDDRRIKVFFNQEAIGSKNCLNLLAKLYSTGDYLFKLDAHCMLSDGYDEELKKCEDNWVVIPRFYVLNAEDWKWQDDRFYDYFYLPCPFTDPKQFRFQAGGHWKQRTNERLDILVDENMKLHGSSFFMSKKFFNNHIIELDSSYDNSSGEDIEISLKTWLSGQGKLMVNKNCWYAHMHKGGQRPRGYYMGWSQIKNTYDHIARYWMGNKWENRKHDLEWLIDKFYPVPTWPENFKDYWKNE
jgi:glycosyltransferase involved in cell wall biosynthesis